MSNEVAFLAAAEGLGAEMGFKDSRRQDYLGVLGFGEKTRKKVALRAGGVDLAWVKWKKNQRRDKLEGDAKEDYENAE